MKAKTDKTGNLFVNKGNGYLPMSCSMKLYNQCNMQCSHFGEPKLVTSMWERMFRSIPHQSVRIKLCQDRQIDLDSLYFENTCIRLQPTINCRYAEAHEVHDLDYWVEKYIKLKVSLGYTYAGEWLEIEGDEDDDEIDDDETDDSEEMKMIKAYHLPDDDDFDIDDYAQNLGLFDLDDEEFDIDMDDEEFDTDWKW